MAYDTDLRRTVLFGGNSSGSYVQDTWIYRTPLPADVAPFGAGCAGSAGVPVLANAPYSLPWIGDTARNRVNVAAGQLGALFVTSLASLPLPIDLGQIGMPGCLLFVLTDFVEFRTAQDGVAEWTITIPNSPSLVAVRIRQQAFPLDVPSTPLGLVASNALLMTLGIR